MDILYIKNMVCDRCVMVVRNELERMQLPVKEVTMGQAVLENELSADQEREVINALEPLGFKLIGDRKEQLAEQVKNIIIELVHRQDNSSKINLSQLLAERLNHDYDYIYNTFNDVTGTSIEKYFIAQKTERIKELLEYGELTVAEIAHMLNYSSTAYLSNQFKKATGLTPGQYKRLNKQRTPLDSL